jgi:histidine triad (HIT) family protein
MREAPPDNIFGRILRGELPSYCVYEDEAVYAFLDIYPQAPCHMLVVPRSYSPNLFAAPAEEVQASLAAVRRLAPAVQRAAGAAGVTVLTNTGRDAGQMVEYLHWHIIPRQAGDRVSLHQLGAAADPAQLAETAARIRAALTEGELS